MRENLEPCTLVKLGPVRDAGLGMLFIMAFGVLVSFLVSEPVLQALVGE